MLVIFNDGSPSGPPAMLVRLGPLLRQASPFNVHLSSHLKRHQSLTVLLNSCAMSSQTSPSKLADFSTCELSDALIKIGLPHGGHIPDIELLSPRPSPAETRICGPAYTVQMVLASDKLSPKPAAHFVDTAPEGSVIVINAPPR